MTSESRALLIASGFAERRSAFLQARTAGTIRMQLVDAATKPDASQLADVEAAFLSVDFMGSSNKQKPNELLALFEACIAQAPRLKWLHTCSSGTDRPLLQEAMRRGVVVTTSTGANSASVAHSAIAGMLALNKGIRTWIDHQKAARWASFKELGTPRDLRGQKAVVIGLGEIGQEVARVCAALGLRVTGVRNSHKACAACEKVVVFFDLMTVLADADWVFLCCPLNAQTRGLVDRGFIERLPRQCSLVNVGRGELVVEEDLLEALTTGRLASAYSDVFHQEPLPSSSGWWSLPNALVSPHVAGLSSGFAERTENIFLDNLSKWLDHEPLSNVARPA